MDGDRLRQGLAGSLEADLPICITARVRCTCTGPASNELDASGPHLSLNDAPATHTLPFRPTPSTPHPTLSRPRLAPDVLRLTPSFPTVPLA